MYKKLLLKKLLLCPILLLLSYAGMAQTNVKGTVTDAQGLTLPGVTVTVKGSTTATNTDANGSYAISAPANGTLVFTMIGFTRQEHTVSGPVINIKMADEVTSLNEVVVVGYGTQRRRDITGSVASVKGDLFKSQPITNPTEALQGRVAGVDIVKSSGAPDARPSIIIRGLSSLNQPPPLYIVDGVRSADGNNINVQDIESIDVLKDASSAAIYGSAAAGGVILITTKKGIGLTAPVVNFNARYGISKPKVIKLLDKDGYIKLQNIINPTIFANANKLDTLANTDWTDVLYRDASETNYNLSVNGSTPVVNYLVSGFYNKQKGVYINNYSNIYGGRVNTDFKLGKYIKIGEQVAVSQRRTGPPIGVEAQLHNAPFRTIPIIPLYNKNGNYGTTPTGYPGLSFSGPNPFGAVKAASAENFKNNFQGNVYAEIKLPLGLSFRSTFGYNYYHETQDYFQDVFNFGAVANPNNSLNKMQIASSQVLSNYVLNYEKALGKHNFGATAGYEQITGKYNNLNVTESNIGLPGYSFVQTSATGFNVNGKTDNNALIKSYFGRVNYNYNGRYYISGSIRQDANYTVFGPNKQKGVFPAASAGWNISEEPFLKAALPFVSNLKIRGSYGELGNSNIGVYRYLANYGGAVDISYNGSVNGQNFFPGGPLLLGATYSAIPNPDLHWETVKETNIGIDGNLFNDKLYFTLEWYNKKTVDMLYALPVSLSSGITEPYLTNVGSVSSKGIDVLLGYRSKAGKVGFDVSVTAGFNRNKVLSLTGTTTGALYDGYNYYSTGDAGFNMMPNQRITISKAGLPFGSFYGYKVLGMFKTDEEGANQLVNGKAAKAGDLIFQDLDGNKTINDQDRQVIGNPNPKMTYGINIRLNYEGFDLAALFNGVAGVDLFNGVKAYEQSRFADGNSTDQIFGASFLGSNGLTSQPRIGFTNPGGGFTFDQNGNYSTVNSYFVESGSYLKLKNLQIGYTFSGDFLKKAGVKSARVFVMGNNVFTITKYKGLDPELASAFSASGYPGPTTRGIDAVSQYPQTRIYSAGIDFNF
jgi:TonB-linked SusC/RagA family outer membrane protein